MKLDSALFRGSGSEISAISAAMHYLKTPCFQWLTRVFPGLATARDSSFSNAANDRR
ncbi:hypothetical protein PSAB6_70185 [Paraburkholderia sabiae]|nr:hypothetical protein PSAB6_70185 [Paraburkholderia sabiae]